MRPFDISWLTDAALALKSLLTTVLGVIVWPDKFFILIRVNDRNQLFSKTVNRLSVIFYYNVDDKGVVGFDFRPVLNLARQYQIYFRPHLGRFQGANAM